MKPTVIAIVLGLALTADRLGTTAATPPAAASPQTSGAASPGPLVVHEWGTFTSFSGSNGIPAHFQPDNTALPGFVYRHDGDSIQLLTRDLVKSAYLACRGTISMETPVMYFYADRPMHASIRVGFPKGWITDWYPHAATAPDERSARSGRAAANDPGESIRWEVKLLPGEPLRPEGEPAAAGLPVGLWTIEFANGVTQACEISATGKAAVVESRRPGRAAAGRAEVKSGAVVIAFEDGPVERWKPDGDRFAVEHWATSAGYPGGTPVRGIARANPYFHARETDAVAVEATFEPDRGTDLDFAHGGRITQREKFLFYRGVGTFPPPVAVRAEGNGKVRVRNVAGGRVTGLMLVTVRNGRVGFVGVGELDAGGETVAGLPPEASTSSSDVAAALEKALIAAGLYEREAKAMVKTWDHAWFHEEGIRLLYLVPPARTDELLPLSVSPKPKEVVRVMVGRHDFLTPEQEAMVEEQLRQLKSGAANKASVDAEIAKLGRFAPQARQLAQERLKTDR